MFTNYKYCLMDNAWMKTVLASWISTVFLKEGKEFGRQKIYVSFLFDSIMFIWSGQWLQISKRTVKPV